MLVRAMTNKQTPEIRILLNSKTNQVDFLYSAVSLARQMHVGLQGMFIEEENLLRAADLPISREVSLRSAHEREISGETMQRSLRSYALNKKNALEKLAQKESIESSFQVIRGERMHWILGSNKRTDILFIDAKNDTHKTYQNLQYCRIDAAPLKLLYNGSIASQRALKIAFKLAQISKKPLLILNMGDAINTESELSEKIQLLLNSYPDIAVNVESINNEQVSVLLRKLHAFMFIYPRDIEWSDKDKYLENILRSDQCPIVLVK